MDAKALFQQLKRRRVIRAAVFYLATAWIVLQVADLLAGANMVSASFVRLLLLGAIVGFPLVLVVSWIYDAPWKSRKWMSIAGDLIIILSIVVGAALMAWQQWLTSFTRPVIAVVEIVATDTREDTAELAVHIADRLRLLLATRPEIAVTETSSSLHPSLQAQSASEISRILGANLLLRGTINQSDKQLRLALQLQTADGETLWNDQFEARLSDQISLQNAVLNSLWPQLPLPADELQPTREIAASCEYPIAVGAMREVIQASSIASTPLPGTIERLNVYIEGEPGNGLLHLARARANFALLPDTPRTRQPMIQRQAMQDLDRAARVCPDYPPVRLARLLHTRTIARALQGSNNPLRNFPNSAPLRAHASAVMGDQGEYDLAVALASEAVSLDPLNGAFLCTYRDLLRSFRNVAARSEIDDLNEAMLAIGYNDCRIPLELSSEKSNFSVQ